MREMHIPTTKWRLNFRIRSHRALRKLVFERDDFTCQECGVRAENIPPNYDGSYTLPTSRHSKAGAPLYLAVDHIVSRCRGEGYVHSPENLQVLCGACNTKKRNEVDVRG